MKKTLSKKLSITKETVSNLNGLEMRNVKGGHITDTCPDYGCETDEIRCSAVCPIYTDLCNS